MSKRPSSLDTPSAVIDALGGTASVAKLTGRSHQNVSNWRKLRLPANTYILLTAALAEQGLSAAPSLWGMSTAATLPQVASAHQ